MVWGLTQSLGNFPFLDGGLWFSMQKVGLVCCRIPLISSASSWDLTPMVWTLPLAHRAHKLCHVLSLFSPLLFYIKTHFLSVKEFEHSLHRIKYSKSDITWNKCSALKIIEETKMQTA